MSPALAGGFFTTRATLEAHHIILGFFFVVEYVSDFFHLA